MGIPEADELIKVLNRIRDEDDIITYFYNDDNKAKAWISQYSKDLEKAYHNFRNKYIKINDD